MRQKALQSWEMWFCLKKLPVLSAEPKFSYEPSVPAHDLLAINRSISSLVDREGRERCLLEGVEALNKTVNTKPTKNAKDPTKSVATFFKQNNLRLIQADKNGGCVVFNEEGFNKRADEAIGKNFVRVRPIMPMTALVLIVSGIAVILASLIMICYCMARLRTQLQRALEEERAYRSRKVDSWSEGPYSEFVDTYGSMIPRQPLLSSVYQSGDQAGPYARRLSSMPRAVSYTQ
ncbi:hypothetical protein HPB52_012755 [Rhipicephalus sanguineus]|uniref:Uncharacterized protein n=2 Tax=Rhipicephalus sanguineus TaxID=34632 RepID=A0A9D4PZY5_RHISA|nr:hypothetical protein HPB52_012755 [Rhipicephalus sanguineus]